MSSRRKPLIALLTIAAVSVAGLALSQITTPAFRPPPSPAVTVPHVSVLPKVAGTPSKLTAPPMPTVKLTPFQPAAANSAAIIAMLKQSKVEVTSVAPSYTLTPSTPYALNGGFELRMSSVSGYAEVVGRPEGWFTAGVTVTTTASSVVQVGVKAPKNGQRFLFDFQAVVAPNPFQPASSARPFQWIFSGNAALGTVTSTQSALAIATAQHVLFVWTSPKDYAPTDVSFVELYPSFDPSLQVPPATPWYFTGVQVTELQ